MTAATSTAAPEQTYRNKKERKQLVKLRRPGYAVAKYVRISPRKVRLVVDVIRGKSVRDAEDLLRFIPRAASEPISKVLNSASTTRCTTTRCSKTVW